MDDVETQLEPVIDNTEEEVTQNVDRQEGFLAGQANAFGLAKTVEEGVKSTDKSSDFKAAFLLGFLTYFARVYERLDEDLSSEGETIN